MGRFKHGVNGPFVGKVGDVIGSSRYGIPYMKGPYKKRTTNISEKEKFNRIKFAATQAWLKPLTEYLRRGFKGYSATSEGFVSAKSYLHKNALRIENENIIIDPALALLSFGDLPITENAECSLTEPGKITFTWNPGKSGIGYDKDQVMMVAYNIEAKEAELMNLARDKARRERDDIVDIALKEKAKIIDLGSGTGFIQHALQQPVIQVDIAFPMSWRSARNSLCGMVVSPRRSATTARSSKSSSSFS